MPGLGCAARIPKAKVLVKPGAIESGGQTLWRQASVPAVEGGLSAARTRHEKSQGAPSLRFIWTGERRIPPGWEARFYRRLGCLAATSDCALSNLPAGFLPQSIALEAIFGGKSDIAATSRDRDDWVESSKVHDPALRRFVG